VPNLLFDTEDGSNRFLRNISKLQHTTSHHYTTMCSHRLGNLKYNSFMYIYPSFCCFIVLAPYILFAIFFSNISLCVLPLGRGTNCQDILSILSNFAVVLRRQIFSTLHNQEALLSISAIRTFNTSGVVTGIMTRKYVYQLASVNYIITLSSRISV
jgi:hypothetical protein